MTKPEDCQFCDRASIEPRVIRAGRLFVSLLSDPKLIRGHALVIPTRHVESPLELEPEEEEAMNFELGRLRAAVIEWLAPGVDTWQKYQPFVAEGFGGTKMDHLHIHVIPRHPEDGLLRSPEPEADTFESLADAERLEMLRVLQELVD